MCSCQKHSEELSINGFSFLTESGRILEGELIKNLPSKGGLFERERGLIELLRYSSYHLKTRF